MTPSPNDLPAPHPDAEAHLRARATVEADFNALIGHPWREVAVHVPLWLQGETLALPRDSRGLPPKTARKFDALNEGESTGHYPTTYGLTRTAWGAAAAGSGLAAFVCAVGAKIPANEALAGVFVLIMLVALLMISNRAGTPPRLTGAEQRWLAERSRAVHWSPVPGSSRVTAPIALALIAHQAVLSIAASPAWRSHYLDEHRVRLDLAEEKLQLIQSCESFDALYHQLDSAAPDERDTSPAKDQLSELYPSLELMAQQAYDVIVDRIAALYDYRIRLGQIEGLLANLASLEAIGGQNGAYQHFESVTRSEMATERTQSLTANLADIQAGLRAQLEYLRVGVIESPALNSPLRITGQESKGG